MLTGIITPLSARPLLTYCAFLMYFFPNPFFYSIQHFFSFKSCKQRQERRVEYKVWGSEALHYYQRIKHHILWSGVIFRRGETLKWGHQGYRGWLVSKWLGYEWKHSLHRKYQTRLVTCLWIIQHKKKEKKNLATIKCYWCRQAVFLVIKRTPQIWSQHF